MKIMVIDDNPEELEKAEAAVKEAGHECISELAGFSPLPKWIECVKEVDGVITDLNFDPAVREYCPEMIKPAGLLVVIHAIANGKPVVICTNAREEKGGHHSDALSWIFDGYVAATPGMSLHYPKGIDIPFDWEENKDWEFAVKMLEKRVAK